MSMYSDGLTKWYFIYLCWVLSGMCQGKGQEVGWNTVQQGQLTLVSVCEIKDVLLILFFQTYVNTTLYEKFTYAGIDCSAEEAA